MKVIAILALIIFVSQTQDIPPPVWPQVFSQSFLQSYSNAPLIEVTGKLFYDYPKGMMRIDKNNGNWDPYCQPTFGLIECTQVVRDQKRYLYSAIKRYCCMCCEDSHGCGIVQRDWLRLAVYEGTQNIAIENFYKWGLRSGSPTGHYYAAQTADKVPKRFVDSNGTLLDFVKITYSTQAIPESTFALPSYCNPANTCTSAYCTKRRGEKLSQQ